MKKNIELLSPAGNMSSVRAAVQNGADAIYIGASAFNARMSSENFSVAQIRDIINYAHVRNVKVHLALNTLIKDSELKEAISIAERAYAFGIDAIIVQDLGLAVQLINSLPKLPIHASTQMTVHNLNGIKMLEKLGFKRAVLSRELSVSEIDYICRNSKIEIETFIHGALCISYSGQCLFSSMVGGRSANRGKCAQSCRLPYQLLKNDKLIDNGYLLSTRDLCGLEFIPNLIESGVTSLKIEGRLKSPEYVAIATQVYRKYIDLYLSKQDYIIDDKDVKLLLQAFNRGNFSSGHLSQTPNHDLVFKEKQNNMGIYIGNVSNYNSNKGHVTLNLNDEIGIGDSITFEHEPTKYHVSELIYQNENISLANNNELVTIGRMKGNIAPGDKIFKLSNKILSDELKKTYSGKEIKKIQLNCKIIVKKGLPISVSVKPAKRYENYKDLVVSMDSDIVPVAAINQPITKERIIEQFSKTTDTPFEFAKIDVELEDNLYIPKISELNALRRNILHKLEYLVSLSFTRVPIKVKYKSSLPKKQSSTKISLLLTHINLLYDYSTLENIDRLYIPIKYFRQDIYKDIIKTLNEKFDTYIYMPNIVTPNYFNLISNSVSDAVKKYDIKGFVVSNISGLHGIKQIISSKNHVFLANYTMNIFNELSANELERLGVDTVTLSPELNKEDIQKFKSNINKELVVYGKITLMTSKYCLLGRSNKCYPTCKSFCMQKDDKYYLEDRLGLSFRIIPDSFQNITNIYNSKTLSIKYDDLNIDYARIDILDENIDEIKKIIQTVKNNERFSRHGLHKRTYE